MCLLLPPTVEKLVPFLGICVCKGFILDHFFGHLGATVGWHMLRSMLELWQPVRRQHKIGVGKVDLMKGAERRNYPNTETFVCFKRSVSVGSLLHDIQVDRSVALCWIVLHARNASIVVKSSIFETPVSLDYSCIDG